jgi:hypothetical protein
VELRRKKQQEKVKKLGIKRESRYLYFIDKDGDISRAVMKRENENINFRTCDIT